MVESADHSDSKPDKAPIAFDPLAALRLSTHAMSSASSLHSINNQEGGSQEDEKENECVTEE